jgi:hypothetical protein
MNVKQHLALPLVVSIAALARAGDCGALPDPAWKDAIEVPEDPFRVFAPGSGPGWVKLTILLCDPASCAATATATGKSRAS